MSRRDEHPMLGGRPVMIGDLLVGDDPDDPDDRDADGAPVRHTFAVGSLEWDAGLRPDACALPGLPAGEPWGWTVRPVADEPSLEWPITECVRATPAPSEPPPWPHGNGSTATAQSAIAATSIAGGGGTVKWLRDRARRRN